MDRERDRIEKAVQLARAGDMRGAERLLRKVVDKAPSHFDALYLLGVVLQRASQPDEAAKYLVRAARQRPKDPAVHNTLGSALYAAGRTEEAIGSLSTAIELAPNAPDPLVNRGALNAVRGRFDLAAADYEAAIAADQSKTPVYFKLAEIHLLAGSPARALATIDAAIAIEPQSADAHCMRANILSELGDADLAIAAYDAALALAPTVSGFHANKAQALSALGRFEAALLAHDAAILQAPQEPDAYVGKAELLRRLDRLEESFALFNQALALDPRCADALSGRAANLLDAGYRKEALRDYEALADVSGQPDHLVALQGFIRRQLCDWSRVSTELEQIGEALAAERDLGGAFPVLSISDSETLNSQAGRLMARAASRQVRAAPFAARRPGKIRVGFFSCDFHDHATAHLLVAVLERFDRERFELLGFSFGPERDDAYSARIRRAFDRFFVFGFASDEVVLRQARDCNLNIAVDLKGFTKGSRSAIFAGRAAPVQVNYLGYPASMGADFIDYIVADRIIIPKENRPSFPEKVIYLPHAYQPNDPGKAISGRAFSRAEIGLPEGGFVFCCFNNSFKILPPVFDVWMRILKRAPGAALWLIEDNPEATENLRREAANRGVDPSRLVFSPRIPVPEHLARHRLADVFLDTAPYNAHTTASDALFVGVPIVTCPGATFAGRVAASLLTAAGLPELIARDLDHYEELAVELATRPETRAGFRSRLAEAALNSPLFDAAGYAGHLADAFAQIHRRHAEGQPPQDVFVVDER